MTARPPPAARRRPRRWTTLVGAVLAGHSALGLVFAALIYLICLTGTLAVFEREFQRWEQPDAPVVTSASDEAVAHGLDAIRARSPVAAQDLVAATLPSPGMPRLVLSAGGLGGDGGESWIADAGGRPVIRVDHPATDLIVALHARLLMPKAIGIVLVGLIGIALLALIVSGVLAHPRIVKDAFALRVGGSERLQRTDLHNRLGTWGLPFYLMIALTGGLLGTFLIGFGGVAATVYKGDVMHAIVDLLGPFEAGSRDAAPMPPVAALIARARGPSGATLVAVDLQQPGTSGQRIGVTLRDPADPMVTRRTVYDRQGRQLYDSSGASLAQRMIIAVQPLHFGWFGGLAVEIAYGLFGLSLCVVTSSGVKIWIVRRRDRGRPVRGWSRLWSATEWGQPCALAVAALSSLVMGASAIPAMMWAFATGLILAATWSPFSSDGLDRFLRSSCAWLLIALALIHVAIREGSLQDPASWMVDAVLLAGGMLLLWKDGAVARA